MKTLEELREEERNILSIVTNHENAGVELKKCLTAVRAEIAAAEKAAKLDALRKKFPKGTRVRVMGDKATVASGIFPHLFAIGTTGRIDSDSPNSKGNYRVRSDKGAHWYVHPGDLEVIPEAFSPPRRITHSDQLREGMRVKYHLPSGASNATIKVLKTTGWEAVVEFGYGYLSTDNTNEHFNIAAPGSPTIPITEKDNWVERVEDARACPLGDYPVCCPKARCPHA